MNAFAYIGWIVKLGRVTSVKTKLPRKWISMVISVILALILMSYSIAAEPLSIPTLPKLPELVYDVNFPDSALIATIQKKLGKKPNETIKNTEVKKYCEEVSKSSFRTLDLSHPPEYIHYNIKSLEGIEIFSSCNYDRFVIDNQDVSDLTPLQGLSSLKSISLRGNKIENLEPLVVLNNLAALDISNNKIKDITPLKKMQSLTHIFAINNNIVDISPIVEMVNLEEVNFSDNPLSLLPSFPVTSKLRNLYLNNTKISSIEPLGNLTKLDWLEVKDNKISDINVLKNFTKIRTINISNNLIQDMSILSTLNNLLVLRAADNWISDLDSIRNQKFTNIVLDNNKIDVNAATNKVAINFWKSIGAQVSLANQDVNKSDPILPTPPKPKAALNDIKGHWAEADIQWAYENGIVNGVAPGKFDPSGVTTEEQFLKILLIAMGGLTEEPVSTPWSQKYYDYATSYNYPVHANDRARKITRREVAEIIAATQGQKLVGDAAIQYLLDHNLSKGKTEATIAGYFGGDFLTRAETVKFVRNVLAEADYKTPQPLPNP